MIDVSLPDLPTRIQVFHTAINKLKAADEVLEAISQYASNTEVKMFLDLLTRLSKYRWLIMEWVVKSFSDYRYLVT